MGIKGLKISMIVSISFDTEAMPRLNPQQREQVIGRLTSDKNHPSGNSL
jgi:hypothetical protein